MINRDLYNKSIACGKDRYFVTESGNIARGCIDGGGNFSLYSNGILSQGQMMDTGKVELINEFHDGNLLVKSANGVFLVESATNHPRIKNMMP